MILTMVLKILVTLILAGQLRIINSTDMFKVNSVLYIYSLFNDTIITENYVTLNDRMINK
jgi:hypothetical protein